MGMIVALAAIIGFSSCVGFPVTGNDSDEDEWCVVDTICVVKGKPYCCRFDELGRTREICTLDELLCEDPTLTYDSIGTAYKTKFRVSTAFSSMVVDFADATSVDNLKNLVPKFSMAQKFKMDYYAKFGNLVLYHIEIDYPKVENPHSNNIRRWLVRLVDESLNNEEDVPYPNSLAIGYSNRNNSDWQYNGNVRDVKSIGKFASERYFILKKSEYGDDSHDFPVVLSCALSLRLVSTNSKYYSYQRQTHENNGGMHGFYTESIVSFDSSSNEEITWNYLFKPDCKDLILSLFFYVVSNDAHYKAWESTKSVEEIRKNFEEEGSNCIIMPNPGLNEKGVTFSYQPYSISCFAAGCFHFTIPYEDLKPYMTDRAKNLLDL